MASESPFSSYLKSNHVPSALEADGIAALIADRAQAASEIRARLERLEKEAQVLQDQLHQHIDYIEEHQAIISAFRRLPDKTLVQIFLASQGRFESGVAISHVCRKWRQLVLETPKMWTTIGITLNGPPKAGAELTLAQLDEATLNRVSTYIERSGDLKLSVRIGVSMWCPEGLEQRHGLHESLMTRLTPTVHRWKSLNLAVPSTSSFARLLELQGAAFTSLQYLDIDFQSARRTLKLKGPDLEPSLVDAPWRDLAVGVWTAESITALKLRGIGKSLAEANASLPIHWSTLTSLSLDSRTLLNLQHHHIIPILAACINLHSCSLTLTSHNDDLEPESESADQESPELPEPTLPNLRYLELQGSEVAMRGLASKLDLPSLVSLTTMFNRAPDPAPDGKCALTEWVDRYGDQLLTISFDYVTLTQSNLAHCLSRLPNVIDLRMTGKKRLSTFGLFPRRREFAGPASALIDDDILESLTPREVQADSQGDGTPTCYCPKLQRLECHMGFTERSEEAFVRLILARYGDGTKEVLPGGVRRLEAVVLSFNYVKPKHGESLDIEAEVNRAVGANRLGIWVEYNKPMSIEACESVYQNIVSLRK